MKFNILIIVSILCFCCFKAAASTTVKAKKYDNFCSVNIVIEDGEHYKAGQELAKQVNKCLPSYDKDVKSFVKLAISCITQDAEMFDELSANNNFYGMLSKRADTLFNNLDTKYKQELNGFIDEYTKLNKNIKRNDILICSFFPDICQPLSCSYYSAWGNKSLDGKTIMGRNLDFPDPYNSIHNTFAVISIIENGKELVQAGTLLMPFSNVTMLNPKVTIAVLMTINSRISITENSYPQGFAFRKALENSSDQTKIVDQLIKLNNSWNSIVAVSTEEGTVVLENTIDKKDKKIRYYNSILSDKIKPVFDRKQEQIAVVNTYMLPEANIEYTGNNQNRWLQFYELTDYGDVKDQKIDLKYVMRIMQCRAGAKLTKEGFYNIYNSDTLMSLVYKIGENNFFLAFNPVPQKTTMDYHEFSFYYKVD